MQRKQHVTKWKRGLSEGQLALLLMLPVLIVISTISVYPILRTVYYSFFDLRLNHPSRNTPHFTYSLDVEKFCDGLYTTKLQLNRALGKAGTEEERQAAQNLLDAITSYQAELFNTDERKAQFEQVDQMVYNYQPVNQDELKYMEVSEAEIERYRSFLTEAQFLANAAKDVAQEAASNLTKVSQALDSFDFAIVEPNFVGLKNYINYLKNPRLWTAVANTSIFTVAAVSCELVVGMLLALLMNQNFKGRGLIRASVLIPWSIPASTSAIIWKFMYDGQYGIVSAAMAAVGILPDASVILTTRAGSLFGMIFSDIWKTSPFMALLLLAGLQTIDGSLYEAAKVDGSNPVHSFFHITLPLIKPTILVALLFRTMDTFKAFDLPSVMTNGANNTESISLYAYKLMFSQMDFGAGSAISIVLFCMMFLICMFYIKVMGADLFKSAKA